MDLSTLTLVQLRELQQQIPLELKRREAEDKINILNEVRAFAKARGYAIEELIAKEPKIKQAGVKGKVKVKYRHPSDSTLEWTGRGRKPKWVEAWISEGASIDALSV